MKIIPWSSYDIPWFVRMYDAIMHERERVHLSHVHAQNHGITDLSHFMHVDHLYREIFHAECWEFRPLCDKYDKELRCLKT